MGTTGFQEVPTVTEQLDLHRPIRVPLQPGEQPSRGTTRLQPNPLDREPRVGDEAGDNLGIGREL
jgi:hypothetical protein